MAPARLAQLCNRVAAKLAQESLTRFQLIDVATILTFVQADLGRSLADSRDQPSSRTNLVSMGLALRSVQERSAVASLAELRRHVETAHQSAVAAIRLLERENPPASWPSAAP